MDMFVGIWVFGIPVAFVLAYLIKKYTTWRIRGFFSTIGWTVWTCFTWPGYLLIVILFLTLEKIKLDRLGIWWKSLGENN